MPRKPQVSVGPRPDERCAVQADGTSRADSLHGGTEVRCNLLQMILPPRIASQIPRSRHLNPRGELT